MLRYMFRIICFSRQSFYKRGILFLLMVGDDSLTHEYDPVVIQRKRWDKGNILWALLIGLVVMLIQLIGVAFFDLGRVEGSLLAIVLILIYSAILFFLLEPHLMRETRHTQIRTIEKPVIQYRTIDRPVIRYRTIERPVERKVYVPVLRKRKKLYIHKYKFFWK